MATGRISKVCVKFQCPPDENLREFVHRLDRELPPGLKSAVLHHESRHVLLVGKGRIDLRSGMQSLSTKLGLAQVPIHVPDRGLPDSFIRQFYSLDHTEAVKLWGVITHEYCQRVVRREERVKDNKKVVQVLKTEGAHACVEQGLLPVTSLGAAEQAAKSFQAKADAAEAALRDVPGGLIFNIPVLHGKVVRFTSRFGEASHGDPVQWFEMDPSTGEYVFKSRGGVVPDRRKHYWVYSQDSGYGKTVLGQRLEEMFNGVRVPDPRNFSNVRENAQYVIFDEYGPGKNSIPFEEFKKLTGGNASLFGGNRKAHGPSWVPRPDTQCFFLGNYHPAELYGTWDNCLQKRVLSPAAACALNARLVVTKLDDAQVSLEDHERQLCGGITMEALAQLGTRAPAAAATTAAAAPAPNDLSPPAAKRARPDSPAASVAWPTWGR